MARNTSHAKQLIYTYRSQMRNSLDSRLPDSLIHWLKNVVGDCLNLDPNEIDVRTPLGRYGLDSMTAIEVTALVADRVKRTVPESLLRQYQTIQSLASYIEHVENGGERAVRDDQNDLQSALVDCLLPTDVQPRFAAPVEEVRAVLVTGATGFLGRYLVRALTTTTRAKVYCLVRRLGSCDGRTRLEELLLTLGLPPALLKSRLRVIEGDLKEPRFGICTVDWQTLVREIDAIYHCAAEVDWVSTYRQLRSVNVGSTVDLLKLASTCKRKRFHFISSLAVCYSTTGPREVHEWEDMLPYLNGLHLGYAQTKCVAETLVRRAGERGLIVKIYRPSLICGETRTGVSHTKDILSRVIKACIQMQCAPDLDWILDCCPVDYVADAIVKLSAVDNSKQVFHLAHRKPRHWREFILWMNLFGYSVSPIPYRSWIERLEEESRSTSHSLYQLRPFFLDSPVENQDLTLPELYEEGRRSKVSTAETCQALSDQVNDCPFLDAQLLEMYFSSFIERGFLPRPTNKVVGDDSETERLPNSRMLEQILRHHFQDGRMRVLDAREESLAAEHSIIAELTSWRYRRRNGLVKYIARIDDGRTASRLCEFAVKIKPKDTEVMEVGTRIAAMCSDELGQAFDRHVHRIGLAGSHLRELGIYEQEDRRLSSYVPNVFGTVRNDEKQIWIIVLEWLENVSLKDAVEDINSWTPAYIEVAIRGLAEIHAIWYEREEELQNQNWLGPVMTSKDVTAMQELWSALANHSHPYFKEWLGTSMADTQDKLVETVGEWWTALEHMPRTLIHNDFNPRNIAFRQTGYGARLCAYDWELSTLGIPQHDLAEFLCFVLSQRDTKEDVLSYLELHRKALQEASGKYVDPDMWGEGFRLALCDLLINRFAMYTMIHGYRRQHYFERVICSWSKLNKWFSS